LTNISEKFAVSIIPSWTTLMVEAASSVRPTVKVRVKIKLALYRFGQADRASGG